MIRFAVFGAFTLTTLVGCVSLTSPAREHELNTSKPYWFDYDASRRGAVMVPSASSVKMCSEPSPDVALDLVSKVDASLAKTGAGEAEGSAEFRAGVVELAKRTQMVMFLRESLYRLCEQSLNQQFTREEVLSAYRNVIDTAKEIALTDRIKAQAEAARAIQGLSPDQSEALQK